MKIMALISTMKVSPVLWRAEPVHKNHSNEFYSPKTRDQQTQQSAPQYRCPRKPFLSPKLYKQGDPKWRGDRWRSALDTACHGQDGCPGGHMRPAVPPRSSEAFARCYQRQCGQEQMTATADKQCALLNLFLEPGCCPLLLPGRQTSAWWNKHQRKLSLTSFPLIQQPFLWKQQLPASGREVAFTC